MAQLKDTVVSGNLRVTDTILTDSLKIDGGTSGQFLKADGSVDSNTYALASAVPSAVTESTVSGWGFTKNAAPGTLTTTSTTALSTATNEALSGSISLHKVAKTGTYSDLIGKPTIPAAQVQSDWNATSGMGVILNKPTIPAAVTESTVSGWGFTKNTGTYSKPSGGIPATDLASAVQTSLGKADTALQSFTETDPTVPSWAKAASKPTYTASEVGALPDTTSIPTESTVSGWGFTKNAAPGTLKTNATTAQTASSGEAMSGTITLHKIAKTGTYSDLIGTPTIPTKVSDLTNDSNFTSNTGTVTGVKINGTTKTPTSGTVDLGTVITSETSLSKGTTTGNGNAVTDISVSGHTITLTKGSTFLTSETSLSKGTATGSGNVVTDLSVSGHTITLTKGSTVPVATSANAGKIPRITSAGAWEYVTPSAIYSGSGTPSNSTGNNGDVYLKTS